MHKLFVIFVGALLFSGCATLSLDEKNELDAMADTTVQKIERNNPGLQQDVEKSPGYLVLNKKVVKVPVFGAGGGEGVVVDNATGKRTYVKVSRLEIGGGWGARSYKLLYVFHDPKRLEKAESGKLDWAMGAEASAGKLAIEGSSEQVNPKKGYKVYSLTDGGASATYTLRAIRLKPYRE